MFGKAILVLIPHPDDEVVACATAIEKARAAGAAVFALYLTHGCVARDILWPWQRKDYDNIVARRRAEADAAANFLGIKSAGRSTRPARYLWRELPQVYAEIKAALAAHPIDQLWVPAYEGGNPDHDALNAAGSLFARTMSVLEFAEYNFSGGKARAQEFPCPDGSEQILALDAAAQGRKREALALYKSERQNLNYVGTARECYRPLAAYDYSRPPHPGTLWYARFQWVPFRHPRVDFTKPEQVSAAITSFLGAAATALPESATRPVPAHK